MKKKSSTLHRRAFVKGLVSTSAAALVAELGIGARKFAVEINREVVSKDRLDEVVLQEGDEVNVVMEDVDNTIAKSHRAVDQSRTVSMSSDDL